MSITTRDWPGPTNAGVHQNSVPPQTCRRIGLGSGFVFDVFAQRGVADLHC